VPDADVAQGPALPEIELLEGTPADISPSSLLLDPANYRLLEKNLMSIVEKGARFIGEKSVQDKILQVIVSDIRIDVDSLRKSILANGFLKHERLIVARYDAERYLVLEGNRRLSAVRQIQREYGQNLERLSVRIRDSLATLPCFVLAGPPILDALDAIERYRRGALVYLGIRHLMGAQRWEPASRYEFQAQLIESGWTIEQVAERFGRSKTEVMRDLKAQILYRDFFRFEERSRVGHHLTYNAFAEAARAKSISDWLGWNARKKQFTRVEAKDAFFRYLISRLRTVTSGPEGAEESKTLDESAEEIVRTLRDMLKLQDPEIDGALTDKDFDTAYALYQDRKEGKFAARIRSYIRGLRRVPRAELSENTREISKLLKELMEEAATTLRALEGIMKEKKPPK